MLVYSSGGPDSVFTFLYLVVIGAAAFLLYRTGAVVIASVAALLHGSMVELTAYEVLPRPRMAPAGRLGPRAHPLQPRHHVVGFYGVAFMVSYLSEKLRGAREELESRQKALSRIQTLYANVIASMSSGPRHGRLAASASRSSTRPAATSSASSRRAPTGRRSADIGLDLPERMGRDPAPHAGPRGLPRRDRDRSAATSRRVLGYSLRALKDGRRRGRGAHRLPGPDRGEEARAPGPLQRAARRRRRARRRHRPRDPQSARLDLGLGPGPLQRALGRLGRAAADGDHRLGVQPPLEDPGGVPALRPAAGAPRRRLRRRRRTSSEVMDLFRLSDEVSDAHRIDARRRAAGIAALGRPRPDPADRLQRRQERRARDARRRHADRRGPRGGRLV